MRRPALLVVLLAVVALALAASAGASPQPTPICGFCGGEFADAAEESGVNATVASSHATVQVHENGSATWRVRNVLSQGAQRFRESPSLVVDVAERLVESSRGVVEDPTLVDARMDGPTAVLVVRDDGAAERHAGLLVVDYLHHDGYTPWHILNADTLTIRGPPGTVVANDPTSGTVKGESITWEGTSERPVYEGPQLEDTPLLVFGPDDSTATNLRTSAALFLAVWPLVAQRASGFLLVQVPLFVVGIATVAGLVGRFDPDVDVDALAATIAGVGAVGGTVMLVGVAPRWFAALALLPLYVGVLAWHDRAREHLGTPRRQALAAAVGLAATWTLAAAVLVATGTGDSLAHAALKVVAPAFPLAAMLPLGAAVGDRRRAVAWGALGALSFAAVPPILVDFAAAYGGFGLGIFSLLFVVAALVVPVVGSPLVVLGRRLADQARGPRSERSRRDDV